MQIVSNVKQEDVKPLKKFSINRNVRLGIYIFMIIFSFITIMFVTYKFITATPNSDKIKSPSEFISNTNKESNSSYLNSVSNPKSYENPINGTLLTKEEYENLIKNPPIAVMIDNQVGARQQSGIYQADIVYETLVEGGITRYMPIFWQNKPEKIGPIRSARVYYIELLEQYDALYMHIGEAKYTNNPKTDAYSILKQWGIKTISNMAYFWRDNQRVAPHNAYTSYQNMIDAATKYKYLEYSPVTPFSFHNDADLKDRGNMNSVSINFIQGYYDGTYDVEFLYNKETNLYERKINGDYDKDLDTGQIITPKNVIIQKCTFKQTYDEKGHVTFDTIGSGEAFILYDGKVIESEWKRSSRTERTKYYKKGTSEEIVFNRGMIWVSIVPSEKGTINFVYN